MTRSTARCGLSPIRCPGGRAGSRCPGAGRRTGTRPTRTRCRGGKLAEGSLLAFSLDGQAVLAHRLVLRVVRDTLAAQGRLAAVCRAAAAVLDARAGALAGSLDRLAVRDVPEAADLPGCVAHGRVKKPWQVPAVRRRPWLAQGW